MKKVVACVVVLASVPVTLCSGPTGTVPNSWSNAGPLTSGVNIAASGEPDGFSPAVQATADVPQSAKTTDEEASIALKARVSSEPPTGKPEGKGAESEAKAPEVSSVVHQEKRLLGNGHKALSLGLLIVALAFIARVFASKLALTGGLPRQADGGIPDSGPEVVSPEPGGDDLKEDVQPAVEALTSGAAQTEHLDVGAQLEREIQNLLEAFRRSTVRTELWANKSETALLSGRAKGGDGPSPDSALGSLVTKVSSIASSLSQNTGTLFAELERLTERVGSARTPEQVANAAYLLRELLGALEKIGGSAGTDFFRLTKLTATMANQSKALLQVYPDVVVLANNLSEQLPIPYPSHLPSPTPGESQISPVDLRMIVDSVSVSEALQQAKMQRILRSQLSKKEFPYLILLLERAGALQREMQAAVKSLVQAQERAEEGRVPSDPAGLKSYVDTLKAIKEKQAALGEEMKLELDLCVEQALEHLEAAHTLLVRGGGERWRKSAHPLLGLARTLKRHCATVREALSKWEDNIGNTTE